LALKSTIFKAELQVADMDRNYYADHALTIARHPSETDERMMVRLLAFALNAHERLTFGKGLSDVDDPDLCRTDLTGAIELWIEVGLPDDKTVRRAASRSSHVIVYSYGRGADMWWKQMAKTLEGNERVTVVRLPDEATRELAGLAQRTMRLQCTVQDGHAWLTDGQSSVQIEPLYLQGEVE
jgi:uncharacterized protein YaeQ